MRVAGVSEAPFVQRPAWEGATLSEVGLLADLPAEALAPILSRFLLRGGNLVEAPAPASLRAAWQALPQPPTATPVIAVRGGRLPADPQPLIRAGVLPLEDIVGGHSLAPGYLRQVIADAQAQLAPLPLSVFWLEGAEAVLAAAGETDFRFRLREAFAALEVAVAQRRIAVYGLALAQAAAPFPWHWAMEVAADVLGDLHHFRLLQTPAGEIRLLDGTPLAQLVAAGALPSAPRPAVAPPPPPPTRSMKEFFTVLPVAEARERLFAHLPADIASEVVPLADALDRVTAAPVRAATAVPAFPRSLMDGYAVRAQDTFGASATLPMYLTLAGEVPMGRAPIAPLRPGEAWLVHTGSMLPEGADAVVMVELTQKAREDEIEVLKAAAPGENVLHTGDDIAGGAVMAEAGRRLRPQDLGGLAALGITQVSVARRPRVALLATGDEVVPPEVEPTLGQVRDVNSYAVAGQITRAGGVPIRAGIAPDRFDALLAMARAALAEAEMLVLSAGSSVSVRDMTSDVINALGAPGVVVHGVALKPGKPAILAVCDGKPVIGLPGNPVSAMVVADLFVTPTLYRLQGLAQPPEQRRVRARLTHNLPSQAGRVDYTPARLTVREGEAWAEPVFGKSNQIFTLVFADGMIITPADANGLQMGDLVEVALF